MSFFGIVQLPIWAAIAVYKQEGKTFGEVNFKCNHYRKYMQLLTPAIFTNIF